MNARIALLSGGLLCGMLAGCSRPVAPVPSPGEAKAEAPPAAAAVPFRQLGWDNERFTWEGRPFTGTTEDHYKSGKLKARYGIREGRYHGLVEEWHDNGQQKTRTSYQDGRHEGDNFYWNADGSLQVHKVWKDDQLISETPGERKP